MSENGEKIVFFNSVFSLYLSLPLYHPLNSPLPIPFYCLKRNAEKYNIFVIDASRVCEFLKLKICILLPIIIFYQNSINCFLYSKVAVSRYF